MGQIIGSAAKPKRCNLSQLSQLGTPAAGEHILVSSDNSMNAAGQGNFDCYIDGNGQDLAAALPLKSIADEELTQGSKNAVTSGSVYAALYGGDVNVTDYTDEVTTSGQTTGFVDLRNLSAYETGKTYKITILAKETAVLLMQTRNSSNTAVQTLANNVNVTEGNTYTFYWTKQETEVRLFAMKGTGVTFKYVFTISHTESRGGIQDTITSLQTDVEENTANIGSLTDEVDGISGENTGYSLFTTNGYIKTDGTIQTNSGWKRTGFISINDFVACTVWLHTSVASIAFYQSEDLSSYLGYAGSGTYGTEGTFNKSDLTIPAGTNYVIISTENLGTSRPYTASSITTLVVVTNGLKQRVEELEDWQSITSKNNGFAHISFDDVVFCLHDITQNANTYTSIFDNDFLALLKTLHDTYGAVFSLFVFLEDSTTGEHATGWTLANTTTQFSAEFAANADWLKFGLHALNKNVNYAARSAADAATDYATFVTAIMSITGTTECIDRLPRLGNFAGGLAQMQALRDADAGIIGGLAAYDTRDSYYLTSAESSFAYKKGVLIDAENHLAFYTSLNALEGSAPSTLFNAKNTPATMGRFFNLEWMMHEYAIGGQDYGYSSYDWNTMAQRLEQACQISKNNGYTWEYPFAAALKAGL